MRVKYSSKVKRIYLELNDVVLSAGEMLKLFGGDSSLSPPDIGP